MTFARATLAGIATLLLVSCSKQGTLGPGTKLLTIHLNRGTGAQCAIKTEPPTIRLNPRQDRVQWKIEDACKGIDTFGQVVIAFDKGQANPTSGCQLAGTSQIGPCALNPNTQAGAHTYSVTLGNIKEDPVLEIVF